MASTRPCLTRFLSGTPGKKILPPLALTLLLMACAPDEAPFRDEAKPSDPPVEPLSEKIGSEAFASTHQHLDLGGNFYLFWDLETIVGEVRQLVGRIPALLQFFAEEGDLGIEELAFFGEIDWDRAIEATGVFGLRAIGASSAQRPDGNFRNAQFLHFPNGPSGVFALNAGESEFSSLNYAPAETDLFVTASFDSEKLLELIGRILTEADRPEFHEQLEALLDERPPMSALTVGQIIEGAPTRFTAILSLNPGDSQIVPETTLEVPGVQLAVILEDHSRELENVLQGLLRVFLEETETESHLIYHPRQITVPGFEPVVAIERESRRLFIASHEQFFQRCLEEGDRLIQSADYRYVMEGLPGSGLSHAYLSPAFLQTFSETKEKVEAEFPPVFILTTLYGAYFPILHLQPTEHGAAMVTQSLPDGILRLGHVPYTQSPISMGGVQQNIVVGGLLAGIAIPSFERVRSTSQEAAIMNNLRQIAFAGAQYHLEHDADAATYRQLVEEGYILELTPVSGESYDHLVVELTGQLRVQTASGQIFLYDY